MRKRALSLFLALSMVLSMLPVSALAADAPFTVIVNDEKMTESTESVLHWTDWSGSTSEVPCYTITVPEDAAEATLCFDGEKQWSYYDRQGNYIGAGETSWVASTEHTVAIQDSNGDGELDGISVQEPDAWSTEYFIQFKYETEAGGGDEGGETESADPFLSIAIGDKEVDTDSIAYKGIFKMGDYDADERQETEDYYDYVHEVPYYYVTVPCGTESVDVTYSADTNIFDSGSDAYGYATVIDADVDLVSSATVKSRTFKNAYTLNDDGTQTVRTPVTGYAVDEDGNGMAITLEEEGGTYEAVCLFSFRYDGKNHVYGEGEVTTAPTCTDDGERTFTCSCGDSYTEAVDATGHSYADGTCGICGATDPDYAAPGAEIPEGAPFTEITTDKGAVSKIQDQGTVDYTGYSTYYSVPYYHVTIPADAEEVYVTHPASQDAFADSGYNSAYGYYAETAEWTGSGMTYAFENAEDGYVITLPLSKTVTDWSTGETSELSFVADENGDVSYAVAVERNDYSPICFFSFEYAAASGGGDDVHTHQYDEGVVTTEPTCEGDGVKTFTCSGCDENTEGHTRTEVVAATGHSWNEGEITIEPTCEGAGEKTFTCLNDTSHTRTEAVSATGHSWNEGEITTEPTCEGAGVKTFTCSNDASHTKTEAVSALGHEWGDDDICDRENCGAVNYEPEKDENGIYQIGTAAQLLWFAEAVNSGNAAISGVLTADINLSEVDWPGIGIYGKPFTGSFNGKDHIVTLDGSTFGLFGYTKGTESAYVQIKNVITDGTVKNTAIVHSVFYTNVENCINRAKVTGGNAKVAGIVGSVSSDWQGKSGVTITNCANEGDIQGDTEVGGILGYAQVNARINGCSNSGAVSGTTNVGGIVGYLQEYKGTCYANNSYNTGSVTGSSCVGGIVGYLYNGVSVENCYNIGAAPYGIAGNVYNKTASITNTYYLAAKAAEGVPADKKFENINPVAKTIAEMVSEEFASLLGEAYQQSCPAPVFMWQTPAGHTGMEDGVCDVCELGKKQTFEVALSTGEGYVLSGEATVKEGENYTFTLTLNEGYQKGESFAVKVNGTQVAGNNDTFTCANVEGPLNITVSGVEKIPDFYTVVMPATGNGYRVNGEATAARAQDYTFTVTFVNGFRAGEDFTVTVNGTELEDENGTYTVKNVMQTLTIAVSGVELIPVEDPVSVSFTITQGENKFHVGKATNAAIAMETMDVPYFDISLYDLERYYYNPNCYLDEEGNPVIQRSGDKESAYGVVTALHAYIYATEVYYLGIDPEDAGKGLSHQIMEEDGKSQFEHSVNWTGDAGSSFMNLWDYGTNLNYYVNYMYPLGRPAWGATSDQIPLKDGDVISVHLIENSKVSGSNFAFFTVNDEDLTFDFSKDQVDEAVVIEGDEITLTMYCAGPNGKYITGYSRMAGQQLYWVEEENFTYDIRAVVDADAAVPEFIWKTEGFAGITSEAFVTDSTGCITFDTAKLAPGTYYLATCGGITEGGMVDSDGFVSRGNETGAALFRLIVEAHEHIPAEAVRENEIASTCETEGSYDEVVYCSVCGTYEFSREAKVLPVAEHQLTKVEAKASSYTESGNKEYWVCSVCEKLFADADGKSETTLEAVTLPVLEREENERPTRPSSGNVKEEPKTETEIVKNEDGSVTTIVTDKTTGESKEITKTADGITSTVVTDEDNIITEVSVEIPAKAVDNEELIVLPVQMPVLYGKQHGTSVEINVSSSANPVRVAIPVEKAGTGTVAVIVREDGTEEIVSSSILTENGLELMLEESATVKIVDNSKYFADVRGANHWSGDSVDFVTSRELFNGTAANQFSPDIAMTRGMILTVLARMEGVDTTDGSIWYEKGVAWAVANGLSDGTNPEGMVTREQLAVILFRYAQMKGISAVTLEENLTGYADDGSISGYAIQAMNWAVGKGIIAGVTETTLEPQSGATRAQVATMLHRFCVMLAQA